MLRGQVLHDLEHYVSDHLALLFVSGCALHTKNGGSKVGTTAVQNNMTRSLSLSDIRAHRSEILTLAEIHGAQDVRLFGSIVNGKSTPESDVDFLVTWDYGRVSAWGGVGFNIALEEILGAPVDVVSEKALHPALRQRVLSEAVPL